MLHENNIVTAQNDLSEKVLRGSIGVIVMVYQDPSLAYEVEFFDKNGETIELLTVYENDIL